MRQQPENQSPLNSEHRLPSSLICQLGPAFTFVSFQAAISKHESVHCVAGKHDTGSSICGSAACLKSWKYGPAIKEPEDLRLIWSFSLLMSLIMCGSEWLTLVHILFQRMDEQCNALFVVIQENTGLSEAHNTLQLKDSMLSQGKDYFLGQKFYYCKICHWAAVAGCHYTAIILKTQVSTA